MTGNTDIHEAQEVAEETTDKLTGKPWDPRWDLTDDPMDQGKMAALRRYEQDDGYNPYSPR